MLGLLGFLICAAIVVGLSLWRSAMWLRQNAILKRTLKFAVMIIGTHALFPTFMTFQSVWKDFSMMLMCMLFVDGLNIIASRLQKD